MDLSLAKTMAISLMDEHGLLDKGWCLEFDNASRRFGICRYRPKVIGLSRKLVELNDMEAVKDTVLHEIAHAIAGYKAGHGVEWKMVCIRIGAKPQRCFSSKDTNMPKLKYQATCGGCGAVHQKSRIVKKHVRRACICQSNKEWNDRILLEYW